ncbi:ribosome biogenesis GTP-binding protein YihA/YsxC [Mycoplasma sp. Mirounga ES2805-ORL]|uniref:ribosome biogenesis GTP-binding protein YihA/YsxC n=1 Tax=Mycoplasma sp. Mirounga ES2805-ORL TaxID=754514 RepID=UPI00197C3D97|nr:ribosome biogenesis GTP-binding protein YihA/YsxC [Mycoplasma sp. Mirounga ES2805-ORL]QSF13845.1 YihA family ribosome biogenesis GTP-binding protein [Mycoplasma sp. Mirounga ES2805-ORL]
MWKFEKSALKPETWIFNNELNVCFWGRSNVGKSSLLNAVTNQKISFVSKTPGRTQLINYFVDINNKIIVDLPGYGFAQMSKTKILEMNKYVDLFLKNKNISKHLFLLIDSRTGITKNDLSKINFLEKEKIPYDVIYTKLDKLNQKEKSSLIKKHDFLLKEEIINSNVHYFLVSSEKNINMNVLVQFIDNILYSDINKKIDTTIE